MLPMEPRLLLFIILGFIAIPIWAETVNNSRAIWSTAREDLDLSKQEATDDSLSVFKHDDDLDGGFSSLDGMLQWAIGHSDPAKLQETAKDVQSLSSSELNKRQMEIKELVDELKMPSDAQLMQIALNDLRNSSLPLEDRHGALEELLVLVEPIDNANGVTWSYRFLTLAMPSTLFFHVLRYLSELFDKDTFTFEAHLYKLGGLAVIIEELGNPDLESRTISAWILGKASQNNHIVQEQVLVLGGLPKLMMMMKSSFMEEAIKALYAVSALIRNNLGGQELFFRGAGELILQEILSNSSTDIRLRTKAIILVADIAEYRIDSGKGSDMHLFVNRFFLKSVIELTATADLNLLEKVLYAIKNLLQLRSVEVSILKDFCQLDGALQRLQQHLQNLVHENEREFVMEIENLRREVELIYRSNLDKKVVPQQVMLVPT